MRACGHRHVFSAMGQLLKWLAAIISLHCNSEFVSLGQFTQKRALNITHVIILTARDKAVKEAFAAGEIEDDDIDVIKVLR